MDSMKASLILFLLMVSIVLLFIITIHFSIDAVLYLIAKCKYQIRILQLHQFDSKTFELENAKKL